MGETIIKSNQIRSVGNTSSQTLINPNQINGGLGNYANVALGDNLIGRGYIFSGSSSYISLGNFTPTGEFSITTKVYTTSYYNGSIINGKTKQSIGAYLGSNSWKLDVGNGSSWVVDGGTGNKGFIQSYSSFWVRYQYKDGRYSVLVSYDKVQWTEVVYSTNSYQINFEFELILGNSRSLGSEFKGVIDIKETVVMNGNDVFFDGATAVEGTDYTVYSCQYLGSDYINGSKATLYLTKTVNGAEYLDGSNFFKDYFESFKFKIAFKSIQSNSSWYSIIGYNNDEFDIEVSSDHYIKLYVGGSSLLQSTNQIALNSEYELTLEYSSTDGYSLKIVKDGETLETLTTATTTKPNYGQALKVGNQYIIVDLNSIEIDVDGNRYWEFNK